MSMDMVALSVKFGPGTKSLPVLYTNSVGAALPVWHRALYHCLVHECLWKCLQESENNAVFLLYFHLDLNFCSYLMRMIQVI